MISSHTGNFDIAVIIPEDTQTQHVHNQNKDLTEDYHLNWLN